MKEFKELKELTEMDGKKRYLIGYFEDKNTLEYANFRKSAMNLKDDCVFHAGFGEVNMQLQPYFYFKGSRMAETSVFFRNTF